jgi:hypothetical protein
MALMDWRPGPVFAYSASRRVLTHRLRPSQRLHRKRLPGNGARADRPGSSSKPERIPRKIFLTCHGKEAFG